MPNIGRPERCRLCGVLTFDVLGLEDWYFCTRGDQCYYKFDAMVDKVLGEEAEQKLKKLVKRYIKEEKHLL